MKLILFDIDGTLLLPRGAGRASTRAAMLEIFGTCGELDNHNFGGKTDWHTLVELLKHEGITPDEIQSKMPAYIEAIERHLAQLIGNFPVEACPGALDVVRTLHEKDCVLLGLVTGNMPTTAPIKLRAAGFDPSWFVVGAYGSESMNRDDLPALALERAIRHLGYAISPQQVIVIGDTEADISCARALGATAVAVTTGFVSRDLLEAARPDYVLDDLTVLLDVLDLAC